jgi:hypothetical protein
MKANELSIPVDSLQINGNLNIPFDAKGICSFFTRPRQQPL